MQGGMLFNFRSFWLGAGPILFGLIALYTSFSGGIASSPILITPALYFLWRMRKAA